MDSHFDAVIIGAGPAGNSAALTLKKAGRHVLVVDQASFPRDKVCGGFLGAENKNFLDEWGIWDDLKAQGAREIENIRLASARGVEMICRRTSQGLAGLGVSRRLLDQTFQKASCRNGIVFRDATSVARSVQQDGQWTIELVSRADHKKTVVTARHLIHAAGAPKIHKPHPQDLIGAGALFENVPVPMDEVGLYFASGIHTGVNPFENGLTNVCYVASRKTFERMNRSLPRLFEFLKESNAPLKNFFRAVEPVTPWKAVTVPYRPAFQFYDNGIFYTGDAAAVVHPVIGGGMTLAIGGGVLLGNVLASGLKEREAAVIYQKTFLKLYALRIQFSWRLGRMAHHRAIVDVVISTGPACRRGRPACRKFFEWMFEFNHSPLTLQAGLA